MIEMIVESVRAHFTSQDRIVMLKEKQGERYLPIKVGHGEAFNIAVALQNVTPPRPLTPDLLRAVVSQLGAHVTQVIITDLRDDIFIGRLILDQAGRHIEVDCRPTDAIALAVRVHVPIYIEDAVLQRAAYTPEAERPDDQPARGNEPLRERMKEKDTFDRSKLGPFADLISSLDDLDNLGKPER
jgi:hypothetical protein